MKFYPGRIIIDKGLENNPHTLRILAHFTEIKPVITDNPEELISEVAAKSNAKTLGKYILYIARHKGSLLKECPGTNQYLCCGYNVINSIENCSIECTYCILQHYITKPVIKIHVEMDRIKSELDTLLGSDPDMLFRIGSGELSDSLLYDDITGFSHDFMEYLDGYKNVLFEFKSKTVNIDNLLQVEKAQDNILVGWTVNTPRVIREEEKKATTLEERLAAAEACQAKGYKLTFHFDPIIIYDNYIEEYEYVVDEIFRRINPQNIAWISLGMLRYPPGLRQHIMGRFPGSRIVYGETVHSPDGKIRYFKKLRKDGFRAVYDRIKKYAGDRIFVYFCMEGPEMWNHVMGWSPKDNDDFAAKFNRQLIDKYSLSCKY